MKKWQFAVLLTLTSASLAVVLGLHSIATMPVCGEDCANDKVSRFVYVTAVAFAFACVAGFTGAYCGRIKHPAFRIGILLVILASFVFATTFYLYSRHGRWETLENTQVFKEANEADALKFVLRKGSTCALGAERVVKAFMYREIECSQGTGWIAYEGGYPLRKVD